MSESKLTRRQFAKAAAAGAVAAAGTVPPAEALADQQQPEAANDAQALYEMIRIRYGQYLDAEQLKRVRTSVERNVQMAGRLRKFPVNQDDPCFVFTPDV
jgi:predicted lipid-binding transport protein (Tim44 family)